MRVGGAAHVRISGPTSAAKSTGLQRRVWGTTEWSCPTGYSLVSARHLETAFFSVEPAESFTP